MPRYAEFRRGIVVSKEQWAWIAYEAGSLATFVYLLFFDGYVYTWWNW